MFFCFHSVVFRVWDSLCTNAPLPSVHRLRVGEITEKWNQYRSTHVSLKKKKTIWKRNGLNRLVVSWCSGSQPRFTWSLGQGRMERKKNSHQNYITNARIFYVLLGLQIKRFQIILYVWFFLNNLSKFKICIETTRPAYFSRFTRWLKVQQDCELKHTFALMENLQNHTRSNHFLTMVDQVTNIPGFS